MARVFFAVFMLLPVALTALLLVSGDASSVPGLVLMLLFVAAARLGLPRFMAARMWRTNAMHSSLVEGEASDEAVSIRRPMTQTRLPWTQVRGHKIAPDVTLLYVSPFEFGFLGRSVFKSDQDWEEFKLLVQRRSRLMRRAPGELVFLLGLAAACVVLFAWWFLAPGQ